jgi:hypothetical protein
MSPVWEEEHFLPPPDHDDVSSPLYSGLSYLHEKYEDTTDELDGMEEEQIQEHMVVDRSFESPSTGSASLRKFGKQPRQGARP